MKKVRLVFSLMLLCAWPASAQKTKPWTEWSEKEAQKILSDSAWAQTQTELSETHAGSDSAVTRTQSRSEARDIISSEAARNIESGETLGKRNTALSVNYHVCFLSAKPIRQAFIRMIELQRPDTPPEKVAELRTFVDRNFGDYIVVTLTMDGTDKKRLAPAAQEINSADPEALKLTTYLERKDGKRLPLMDYRAPAQDGLGAKFVFPRSLDGKPFIDVNSGEFRFVAEVGKTVKLNRRFKVAEMMYEGKLEF
jgi:hypothetical protein